MLYARPHVLAANKLFDELLKKTEEERKESPLSITPVVDAVTYLGAATRLPEARELIDSYLTDIEAKTDAETLANCRNRLEAAFAYAGNRFDDFAEFAEREAQVAGIRADVDNPITVFKRDEVQQVFINHVAAA